jgi:hypothetical protein
VECCGFLPLQRGGCHSFRASNAAVMINVVSNVADAAISLSFVHVLL